MTSLPICVAGFLAGIFGSFAQIGTIFSFDPISPDLEKIDPIKGFQRLFSIKQLLEALRLIVKMVAVAWVCYALIRAEVIHSPEYLSIAPESIFGTYAHAATVIFFALIAVLGVFAAFDYGLQRWDFSKNVRLTKEEAKQEFKEREGDPQIKARIKSIQREVARRRMMQAVKKADVIITNPTHVAVALVYDRKKMSAPKVVAKGADLIAQQIKKVAAAAGVPMVENVPLARAIFKSVKVGQAVPRALYQAVAEVLAYVYRLKNKDFRG